MRATTVVSLLGPISTRLWRLGQNIRCASPQLQTASQSRICWCGRGSKQRLNRPVFYELVDLADAERGDGRGPFGLWSDGVFFDFGDPEDDKS